MRKRIMLILLCVTALLFVYSSVKVHSISSELSKSQNEFKILREKAKTPINCINPKILSKYQMLYNDNCDLIGWINLEGTVLDYPVMYTPNDPEYYLRKNFDKEYSVAGVPFVGGDCSINSSNVIIYAHNMKNGTMFNALLKYKDITFWEDHKTIKFDTIYDENKYEVIGAFYSRAYDRDEKDVFRYYDYTNIENEEIFNEYYNQVKYNSLYDTGVEASYGDKLLTLSTCEYSVENGRFVVVAKKIK